VIVNCRFTDVLFVVLFSGTLSVPQAVAGDWPTYEFDYARSGVTDEQVGTDLGLIWRFESAQNPRPAWPEPARNDYGHGIKEIRTLVVHDRAFHVAVANKTAFFGSTVDDKVYALDSETGEIKWTFFTRGPIRLAPTIDSGRLYVGSDDGCVYCLATSDGSLLWRSTLVRNIFRSPPKQLAPSPQCSAGHSPVSDVGEFCSHFMGREPSSCCDIAPGLTAYDLAARRFPDSLDSLRFKAIIWRHVIAK